MTRGDAVWCVCRADRVCLILLRGLVKISVTGKREANWEWFKRETSLSHQLLLFNSWHFKELSFRQSKLTYG